MPAAPAPRSLDVDIKGPNGLTLARHYALDVKAATQILARRSIRTLAKGESLTLTSDMFSDLVPGTGGVSLSASLSTALDAATILKALDRYPYGCSEQITSRAMPLLYVNDLAAGAHLAHGHRGRPAHQGRDRAAAGAARLERLVRPVVGRRRRRLARCLCHGLPDPRPRKGLCGAGRAVQERARSHPQLGGQRRRAGKGRRARSRLRPLCARPQRRRADRRSALSRRHQAEQSRDADCQVATGGGAGAGRRPQARAERVYGAALESLAPKPVLEFGRADYGSALARCRGAGLARQRRQRAAGDADAGRAAGRSGARAYALHLDAGECLAGAGVARAGQGNAVARCRRRSRSRPRCYRSYKAAEMAGKPIKITNTGDAPVQAVVSVSGSPVTPEPAASNGFKIERNYFTLDGKPADVTKAKQNDRFAVVLKITEAKPEYGHIMVSDYLPAGLEIDNPHLVSSGDSGTLDWIEDGEEPENTEFRDDRFTAAIDRAARRQVGVHRRLCRARGLARQIRAAAGLCRGHVQSLALRPHRHRHGRGASGEMSADGDRNRVVMPGKARRRHARACPGHPRLLVPRQRRGWPGQARP